MKKKPYKCKYFKIHELVPPDVLKDRGERAWELLDDRALITLDHLRVKFGKATVNNYKFSHKHGEERTQSGLRTVKSKYYSPYSQHTFGKAFDVIFYNYSAEHVRNYIKNNKDEFPYISAIEDDVSWLHFDVRNSDFFSFKP